MRLTLPWPPSNNVYYRHVHGRTLLSREAREYHDAVTCLVHLGRARGELPRAALTGRLEVRVSAYPPDRRRRDLDNLSKAPLDALKTAGVYRDDSQIDDLRLVRRGPEGDGRLEVDVVDVSAG